jgi:hypothetical protein
VLLSRLTWSPYIYLMKILLVVLLWLPATTSFCQDSLKLRHIDSLVSVINNSNLPVTRDTLNADQPAFGIFIKTYLTLCATDTELKKYGQQVYGTSTIGDKTDTTQGFNVFYFHGNKLIKVEESFLQRNQAAQIDWYYWDEKPLHQIVKSPEGVKPGLEERLAQRAEFLITLATTILSKFKGTK